VFLTLARIKKNNFIQHQQQQLWVTVHVSNWIWVAGSRYLPGWLLWATKSWPVDPLKRLGMRGGLQRSCISCVRPRDLENQFDLICHAASYRIVSHHGVGVVIFSWHSPQLSANTDSKLGFSFHFHFHSFLALSPLFQFHSSVMQISKWDPQGICNYFAKLQLCIYNLQCLQCFDTVGWASGWASGL